MAFVLRIWSDKALILTGDTLKHKEKLRSMYGNWHSKERGWIFSKKRKEQLEVWIKTIKRKSKKPKVKSEVKKPEYKKPEAKPVTKLKKPTYKYLIRGIFMKWREYYEQSDKFMDATQGDDLDE
jgi:hypothetical protein